VVHLIEERDMQIANVSRDQICENLPPSFGSRLVAIAEALRITKTSSGTSPSLMRSSFAATVADLLESAASHSRSLSVRYPNASSFLMSGFDIASVHPTGGKYNNENGH
jgi:hypothetical protein